jgi:hypothetical protein
MRRSDLQENIKTEISESEQLKDRLDPFDEELQIIYIQIFKVLFRPLQVLA